jgi:predicted GNAT family N-acyltransferase
MPAFRVEAVDYAAAAADLHAVRNAVFVREQGVPATLERDAADPRCLHVLARDAAGSPIGAARLVPPFVAVNGSVGAQTAAGADAHDAADPLPRIGRMAVVADWRSRGVGEAMLAVLEDLARQRGWPTVALHAQAPAIRFYMRLGYLPEGPRFHEAGIEHQAMHRRLAGASAIDTREAAIATLVALAHRARRSLRIYSRALDPGLLDAPEVLDALRRFAVRGGGVEIRILLQDAATPQRANAPVLALAQRLPSVLLLREVDDPVDRAYVPAFVANDAGGSYFRPLGHRFDGEAQLAAPGRARQLGDEFDRIWERARPCAELRALGL